MVEMAKANGVNVYHYLTYLLEKMPSDRMSDEELELLAPWNENVKTEIQHRVNNTDQSDVNCQGTPATEKQPGNFLTMAEIYALTHSLTLKPLDYKNNGSHAAVINLLSKD